MRRRLVLVPLVAVLMLASADSGSGDADGSAGVCTPAADVACSTSDAGGGDNAASAESGGRSVGLGPVAVTESNCQAPTEDGARRERNIVEQGEGPIVIGTTRCRSGVTRNGANSASAARVLKVDGGDAGSLKVGKSSSRSSTEGDDSRSRSRFVLGKAQGQDQSLKVLRCESTSVTRNGETETNTDGDVIAGGGESLEDPGLCGLTTSSQSGGS